MGRALRKEPIYTQISAGFDRGTEKAPEIISFGVAGRHNENIEAATSRIIAGATWKHQRIIVLVPSAKAIPAKVALSHWSLIFPPNNAVYRMLCLGHEVGMAYSAGIDAVLNHPELSTWEYVLTIEHDNMPPATGVLDLIKSMQAHQEFACIGGLYWTKGEGGVPQIWGDPADPLLNFRPQVPRPNTVQECCGTGMGFNLWRISMLKDKNLPRPLFKTIAGASGVGTQDLQFWKDARKWGYRCAVDTSVPVGHYDAERDIVW